MASRFHLRKSSYTTPKCVCDSTKTERKTEMKRMIIVAIAVGSAIGGVWAKHPPTHSQQKAAAHAIKAQQKAGARAMSRQHRAGAEMMRPGPHGGVGHHGPHGAPSSHHTFHRGTPPPSLRGWKRGPAPHPHYRSGWYGDIWYDAYGYPYYGPAVVTPAPVVAPAPVVVQPAPVVVQPAPVVAPPPPPVAVPVRHVVY